MDSSTAFALIGATTLLVAIPGPNVALIIANTIARGFRLGAMTVLGTTIGVAIQLAVVVTGLAALLEFAGAAFTWLKWAGVFYLLYLGVLSWRQGVEDFGATTPSQRPGRVLFWQGLLLAMINPKTLFFNAAFLPQFIGPDAAGTALVPVAALYLCVIFLGDLVWASSAHSARPLILRLGRLRHRLTGGLFFGAGVGLALSRVER
ncbi:LysE family translocator [Roseovarius sp. 2305UL8-3]|uniref:LysE family translocator n=1 Tax=Roseovarius conchicola TaxID=3121636 RepID=UPI0035282ED9